MWRWRKPTRSCSTLAPIPRRLRCAGRISPRVFVRLSGNLPSRTRTRSPDIGCLPANSAGYPLEFIMIAIKQILVATDFGPAADNALRYGEQLAREFGA